MKQITKKDVEWEKSKTGQIEFWPDIDEFFDEFPFFNEIPAQYIEMAKDLLYSLCHIFFNANRPDQFRQGINILLIKMDRLPGKVLTKEKVRQISKNKHLEWHIKSMLKRGVMVEAENVVDCFASNVQVVIKRR